jgi:hypothetical protein
MTQFDLATHRNRAPMAKDGVVYFADDIVALWTNKQLGQGVVPVGYVALGILHPTITDEFANRDAEELALNLPDWLAAGCFFWGERSNETGHKGQSDVSVSVSTSDGKMTSASAHPTVIKRILEWPFQVRNLRRISAEIDASNTRAIRNAQLLGFKEEGRKRQAGENGGDIVQLGLLRDECEIWTKRESLKLEDVDA